MCVYNTLTRVFTKTLLKCLILFNNYTDLENTISNFKSRLNKKFLLYYNEKTYVWGLSLNHNTVT